MIIEELKQEFKNRGINMKFIDDVPANRDPRRPAVWMEQYPEPQLVFGCPEQASEFDIAYVGYEVLALAEKIDLQKTDPAAQALENSWVLRSIVDRYGEEFRNRIVEILRHRISSLAMAEESDQELAYSLWSRMAAIEAFEMLRPVRQARPKVADLIEEIRSAWHIPVDANDAFFMYQDPPVTVTEEN